MFGTRFKEEYVYRDAHIKMSVKAMSDLLYAVIITNSNIPTTFGIGIYEYDRSQNCRNEVDIKIHIHPTMIAKFEELSGTKLKEPISITIS